MPLGRLKRCALLAGATAVVVLAVAAPSSQATFPGTNGQIAFWSQLRGDPIEQEGTYVMNPNGTGIHRLPIAALNHTPAWSADGAQLAFTRCQPSGCSYNDEIYKARADGTGEVSLTSDPASDWHPAWSPEGSRIAFNSARQGAVAVWVMSASGANQTRVAFGENPDWSPDGGKIAFERLAGGFRSITLVNPDGTGLTPLTGSNQDFHPSWSPDGQRIAFSRPTGVVGACPYYCFSVSDIFTIRPDGTDLQRLTDESPVSHLNPAWSPDGTKIVYVRVHGEPRQTDLATMSPDGSGHANLTNDSAGDDQPSWQPIVTADVSLAKSDSPDPVSTGEPLTYTLTVSNSGPQAAAGVVLTDVLPKPVRVRRIESSQGRCVQHRRTITCNLFDIGASESATVSIVVRPIRRGTIVNTATVTATGPADPNSANNSATASTQVLP